MIPILYEAKTRTFATNGIGRLHFTSCSVKETMNGEFELEGDLSIHDKHFKDVENDRIIVASCEVDNNLQPFRIYNCEKKDEGTVTVHAEHISYWLSHIPVYPFESLTVLDSLTQLKVRSMEENPFTFYTNVTRQPYVWTDDNRDIEIEKWSSDYSEPLIQNPLDEESKKLAELENHDLASAKKIMGDDDSEGVLGVFKSGEWRFDNFNCYLLERRGKDTDIIIRYGKNLKTLTQEENIQNTITGLIPYFTHTCSRKANEDWSEEDKKRYLSAPSIMRYRDVFIPPYGNGGGGDEGGSESSESKGEGDEGGDSEDDDPGTVERTIWCMLPGNHVWHTDNVDAFAYPRTQSLDCSSVFDHSPSFEELRLYTLAYADQQNIGIPELSLKIDFEYLWQLDERPIVATLEKLHMGDSIHVVFPKLDVTATGEMIEYDWDVLTDTYKSITIGNVTHSLAKTIENLTRATAKEQLKFVASKWEQLENGVAVLNRQYYQGTKGAKDAGGDAHS